MPITPWSCTYKLIIKLLCQWNDFQIFIRGQMLTEVITNIGILLSTLLHYLGIWTFVSNCLTMDQNLMQLIQSAEQPVKWLPLLVLEFIIHRIWIRISSYLFLTGNHAVVSIINNFIPRTDIEHYTVASSDQAESKLPPAVAPALHKFVMQVVHFNRFITSFVILPRKCT